MIESEFALFQVSVEVFLVKAPEFGHPRLGYPPEVFNAVDMRLPTGECVVAMFHPVVPPKKNRREPWEYDKELYKK